VFAWQNVPEAELLLPGLTPSALETRVKTAKFDLLLDLQETPDGIRGYVNYATALFDASTVERYVAYLRRTLEARGADEGQLVSCLPWMGDDERRRVLQEWNATGRRYPRESGLAQLFEEEATRSPESVAVEFGEEALTYRELNARANALS